MRDFDDTFEYLIRLTIFVMAFMISFMLFTQFFNEYSQAVNSYQPLENTYLKALVNSKLFTYLLFANIFAFGLLINAILKEVYLLIMLILETALLLYNRPKHLKRVYPNKKIPKKAYFFIGVNLIFFIFVIYLIGTNL